MRVTGLHDVPQKKMTRLDDFFGTRIYRTKKLHELQHTPLAPSIFNFYWFLGQVTVPPHRGGGGLQGGGWITRGV